GRSLRRLLAVHLRPPRVRFWNRSRAEDDKQIGAEWKGIRQTRPMQRLLASLTIVLLLGMVITRVLLMRRSGIRAMHFGKIDKKDFHIPPFAFFYFYIVFAAAFGWPT